MHCNYSVHLLENLGTVDFGHVKLSAKRMYLFVQMLEVCTNIFIAHNKCVFKPIPNNYFKVRSCQG